MLFSMRGGEKTMWILFSIFTVIFWAGSDFFCKKGTLESKELNHLKITINIGLIMGIFSVIYMFLNRTFISFENIVRYLPVSFFYILSMILGFIGLKYIELSISSPICNASCFITTLLCFFILKQDITFIKFIAVVVIVVSIIGIAVSIPKESKGEVKYDRHFIAIIFPILYCLLDGIGSFLDATVLVSGMSEVEVNIAYNTTFFIFAIFCYVYLALVKKIKYNPFSEKEFTKGAICETLGQATYVFAMASNAIIASPFIATYSVFSVILSRIFLKEKLTKTQYVLITFVICAMFILSIE